MYTIDELDTVVELSDAPQIDSGAPLPVVVSDEHCLLLAYLVSEPVPDWDGSCVTVVSPESEGMLVAIVEFRWPYAHMFGPPNDEAFFGHPLAERGLHPYAVHEIQKSSWVRRLERMNALHPRHDPELLFAGLKHFVLSFHDSTFECVAEGGESHGDDRRSGDAATALLLLSGLRHDLLPSGRTLGRTSSRRLAA